DVYKRQRYEREGAWLLPTCGGARVDLAKVDRATLSVFRMGDPPARWCITDIFLSKAEPPRLESPLLTKGPLIDELGQSTPGDWPGRTRSVEEAVSRLFAQAGAAAARARPAGLSRWGGSPIRRFDGNGFFSLKHDGRRWWLVDPEGYVFWSAGVNGVRAGVSTAIGGVEKAASWLPDPKGPFSTVYSERPGRPRTINFLAANFIRAFGPDLWYEKWIEITLGHLAEFGFNTMGWQSDWRMASRAKFPYVRSIRPEFPNTPKVYRDFPDVYDPWFREELKACAEPLRETAEDPAMIGYFLMSEPEWSLSSDPPGVGMLLNTTGGACRQMLAMLLRQRYRTDERLSEKWGVKTTFAGIMEGKWTAPLNETARRDLTAFSTVMLTKLFDSLSEMCRKADPRHLNLGVRYFTVPPPWAVEAMRSFDVVTINCYRDRPYPEAGEKVAAALNKPVLIGEWHFGALDAGLPGGGMMRVRDQEARGRAFRTYIEDAAARPWCVGAHWSDLYDQPALGSVDGACSNIGFLDVCNRPYEPLAKAARASM
ncbi:MAG: hypothetical protein N3A38_16355, partial [Planctomycetota bacterium]|nr:hypothetical protein [Planctomycetota bacterium]